MVKKKTKQKKKGPDRDKFVTEMLRGVSSTQAAINAGYSKKGARSAAHRLLQINDIATRVNKFKEDVCEKAKVNAAWVLNRLALIADFNINKFLEIDAAGKAVYNFNRATDQDWYCINEYAADIIMKSEGFGEDKLIFPVEKIKLKAMDRLKAIELIGKHKNVQAFRDEVKITGKVDLVARITAARKRAG